jgi:hypothetical protein
MKRLCCAGLVSAVVATFAACAGHTDANPTAPAPVPGLFELRVTSGAMTDTTIQLTATARFVDGSSRDVTSSATWTSSDPTLATVSSTGLVTAVGGGPVDVRATYQGVTGALTLQVGRPIQRFGVSGVVREVGGASGGLGGVRLEIVRGPGAGTIATSDAAGSFRLAGVMGMVDITASKPGYIDWRLQNLTVDHDMQMDVGIYLTPPTDASGARATVRCQDGSWSWAQTVSEACTGHGGVLYGVCPGMLCAASVSTSNR